jgi:adenylate cyclase class IV
MRMGFIRTNRKKKTRRTYRMVAAMNNKSWTNVGRFLDLEVRQ